MKQYIKDFLASRKRESGDYIRCEFGDCQQTAVDVHHIQSSFRGPRKHKKDGSDLIALCREHHEFIHNNNDHHMREGLTYIVSLILRHINSTR